MHHPLYHGEETDFPLVIRNPAPRYSLAYTANDGDDYHGRPQIEIHATIGYDLDGTAVHVRSVTVNAVVMYARPDFDQGREVPFTDAELQAHAPFVKAQSVTDEAWQQRAWESAIEAERCGDGDY